MRNTIIILTSLLLVILSQSSCVSDGTKLSGAGATFPAPFYNIVFRKHTELGGSVTTYGGIGSGAGVRNLKDKVVDFGATDVFISDKELEKIGEDILHIPTALGGVVLSYNLPTIKELRLNAEIITAIYLGEIDNWNDSRIKVLNPNEDFPDQHITAVYRSDGSGTTAVFSDYMSKANSQWKEQIGKGKSLKYPTGIAAKGNPGVAGIVSQTGGAIGYIGSEYALALNMASASLQNSAGNFIVANEKSISTSANIEMPADTRTSITNSDNPEAYPISTFTWIVLYKEQNYNGRSIEKAQALKSLLLFIISPEGQGIATKTSYAPLSGTALETTKQVIEQMTYDGKYIELESKSTTHEG